MTNTPIPPEMVQDPPAVNQPEIAHIVGRDPERTPMQWDDSPNGGFCPPDVQPWLPVNDNYREVNVAAEAADPHSFLHLYKALTALRRAEPALHLGSYRSVDAGDADVFAYLREAESGDRFLIVLNFSDRIKTLDLSDVADSAEIAVSSDMLSTGKVRLGALFLAENQGLVLRL
jgi:alpha-glucosidase